MREPPHSRPEPSRPPAVIYSQRRGCKQPSGGAALALVCVPRAVTNSRRKRARRAEGAQGTHLGGPNALSLWKPRGSPCPAPLRGLHEGSPPFLPDFRIGVCLLRLPQGSHSPSVVMEVVILGALRSSNTRGFILERSLTFVRSAGKPSGRAHAFLSIREYIPGRSFMCVLNVGRPLHRKQI